MLILDMFIIYCIVYICLNLISVKFHRSDKTMFVLTFSVGLSMNIVLSSTCKMLHEIFAYIRSVEVMSINISTRKGLLQGYCRKHASHIISLIAFCTQLQSTTWTCSMLKLAYLEGLKYIKVSLP